MKNINKMVDYLWALDELVQEVHEVVGNPVSVWAVAAGIESIGIRDMDAQKEYGFDDVFHLAQYVYKELKILALKTGDFKEFDIQKAIRRPPVKERLKTFLKHYTIGLLFAIPMLLQIISVLTLDYGLWAWLRFNEMQATMVAIGTILAFVLTGGFVQMLGFQITYYKGMQNYLLAYKISNYILKKGIITIIVIAISLMLINYILPFFPMSMMFLAVIYMLFLSALLLSAGVLYALEQKISIGATIIIGTLFVLLGMHVLHIGIYFSHWLGMGIASVLNFIYSFLYFQVKMRTMPSEYIISRLPRPEVIFTNSYRYFVYGTLFFLFLFMDRILAWSAGPPPPTYIIWFNTPYELGMDWALMPLMTTMAVLDYAVHSFSKYLIPVQQNTIFNRVDLFNNYFKSFYHRQLIMVLGIGVISIIVSYYFLMSFEPLTRNIPNLHVFYENPITEKTYWMGAIGYLFLCIGLLNSLFFFTLGRPAFAMNAMLYAVMANFLVGFIFSRAWSYEYGALGLIAGAFTFAVLSGIWAQRFFNKLDYFYYAAF